MVEEIVGQYSISTALHCTALQKHPVFMFDFYLSWPVGVCMLNFGCLLLVEGDHHHVHNDRCYQATFCNHETTVL